MKTLTLIVTLSFLLITAGSAEEAAISQIRKEYQSIRKTLPTLKVESADPPEPSTEGGEVKAYRDSKGNIRLIRMELYFESGKEIEEYYYQNNLLIFTLYEEHRYNVPMNVTPEVVREIGGQAFDPRKTSITANRYYFNNGKMIRWIDAEKKEVEINSKEFREAEKSVSDSSKKLLTKFK